MKSSKGKATSARKDPNYPLEILFSQKIEFIHQITPCPTTNIYLE